MNYKRIGKYWHRLTTPQGVFYGHNRRAVFDQARESLSRSSAQIIPWRPRAPGRSAAGQHQ